MPRLNSAPTRRNQELLGRHLERSMLTRPILDVSLTCPVSLLKAYWRAVEPVDIKTTIDDRFWFSRGRFIYSIQIHFRPKKGQTISFTPE